MTLDILSFLQQQGKSRRWIIAQLQDGLISKNGHIIQHRKEPLTMGDKVTFDDGETTWDWTVQEANNKTDGTIILYNKPVWCVVSKADAHNRTIYDLLPPERKDRYIYIGRLDKDSRGLLVLTDVPELVSFFSHPRNVHEKTYIITTRHPLSEADRIDGKKGLVYVDHDTNEETLLSWISCTPYGMDKQGYSKYKVILTSWKKRHIRRLCEMLDNDILDLQRIGFGPWELNTKMKPGTWETIVLHSEDLENLLAS